jgi:2-hydroxy-3-keto-5-methylthiopentenyl-1-phosphate phosphatase
MPDCRSGSGTCKCAVAKETKRRTLMIGDGRSDFCVAQTADFVFAKDKLLVHCREHGIPHEAFADFAEAEMLLKLLIQRQLVAPALEPVVYG